jgi:hypothetical protein
MLVKLKIWEDIASNVCGVFIVALEPFVMSQREVSTSLGVGVFCKASIVAEGGVFSPRMALKGGLDAGLRLGASLTISFELPFGCPALVGLLSGTLFSESNAGIRASLSGERSPEESPSKNKVRSRGLPLWLFCRDCMRLWYWPLIRDLSGDLLGDGLIV